MLNLLTVVERNGPKSEPWGSLTLILHCEKRPLRSILCYLSFILVHNIRLSPIQWQLLQYPLLLLISTVLSGECHWALLTSDHSIWFITLRSPS